jgi:LuxR family maltose regulon positive regulatory protein
MISGVGGAVRTFESARAVRAAGPSRNPWWNIAPLLEASSRFAIGDDCDLVELFGTVEVATRDLPAAHALALAHLALAHLLRHEDERAESIARRAIAESHEYGLDTYFPAVNVQTVYALVAARRDHLDESQQAAIRAERLFAGAGRGVPRGMLLGRLLLAEAALVCNDPDVAARNLRLANDLLQAEPDALRFHEWATRLTVALRRMRGGVVELTRAERRVLDELTSHRSLTEIADHLYLSRNTIKSHTVSIYRKLGVPGRSAAVQTARDLNLIE